MLPTDPQRRFVDPSSHSRFPFLSSSSLFCFGFISFFPIFFFFLFPSLVLLFFPTSAPFPSLRLHFFQSSFFFICAPPPPSCLIPVSVVDLIVIHPFSLPFRFHPVRGQSPSSTNNHLPTICAPTPCRERRLQLSTVTFRLSNPVRLLSSSASSFLPPPPRPFVRHSLPSGPPQPSLPSTLFKGLET